MRFSISHIAKFDQEKLAEIERKLSGYTNRLNQLSLQSDYSYPESSILLPQDQKVLEEVQSVYEKTCSEKLKYIVVIGIGGSNLGTKAIYDAIYGTLDYFASAPLPKIFFADTCDAKYLSYLQNFLLQNVQKAEELLLVMISKSGSTTETVVNFEILYAALQNMFNVIAERVVVITDFESPLWVAAHTLNFALLPIPKLVGGRFSVFSCVGLFPLLVAGIDIESFRDGATAMLKRCLQDGEDNPALKSAALLFYYAEQGQTIHDTFLFQPVLESLGKWYRQLLAESVGKEKNKAGDIVHVGITPTVSIGSTDLHSMAQLYLGGPRDKLTTFVSIENHDEEVFLPETKQFNHLAELGPKISTDTIINAILSGVKVAYTNAELPFIDVQLKDISPYSLGEFMQWKMLEIMYLAELFQINAFDQPNVEMYKVETKKLLQK